MNYNWKYRVNIFDLNQHSIHQYMKYMMINCLYLMNNLQIDKNHMRNKLNHFESIQASIQNNFNY